MLTDIRDRLCQLDASCQPEVSNCSFSVSPDGTSSSCTPNHGPSPNFCPLLSALLHTCSSLGSSEDPFSLTDSRTTCILETPRFITCTSDSPVPLCSHISSCSADRSPGYPTRTSNSRRRSPFPLPSPPLLVLISQA